jgi:prephenate dehydratase
LKPDQIVRNRIAIQGEQGSNSAMAAEIAARNAGVAATEIVTCAHSAQVFDALALGQADWAVLPIENSLHGSVAEHYDLLLEHPVRIAGETLLHIQHNVIAAPGVKLQDVKRVLSHPVALAQCRQWLRARPGIEPVPFYDTAGGVRHLMELGLRDTAAIAPQLAADHFHACVLVEAIEDHRENYTRFFTLQPIETESADTQADKLSVAFSLDHRPGTLLLALEALGICRLNLTRIESRPVPGSPWEYVFFVDARFDDETQADAALAGLRQNCRMVKELGRYRAALT